MSVAGIGCHGPGGSFNGTTCLHSWVPVTSYVLPSASSRVRRMGSVRFFISIFMGLPFGGDGWRESPIIKLAGNPATFYILFMGGHLAHQAWGLKSAFRGVKLAARHIFRGAFLALCPPRVCALGGLFLFRGGVGVHGTNGRFFWLFKPLNCSQQSCDVV